MPEPGALSPATIPPAPSGNRLFGLMAEFADAPTLLTAARRAYAAGYRQMEAYTPFEVDGLQDALGKSPSRLGLGIMAGGIAGAATGMIMQWYATVISYPVQVGGRPLFSWPAYLAATFELSVLFASLTALLGTILLCGFPHLHHPVFGVPAFRRATNDRFFLCLEAVDAHFAAESARAFLEGLEPLDVHEVAP